MTSTSTNKFLVAVLAIVFLAAACGGADDSDAASTQESAAETTDAAEPSTNQGDAESDLSAADDSAQDFEEESAEESAGEAMEADAMADDDAGAPPQVAEGATSSRAVKADGVEPAPDGGLFEDEQVIADDSATDNNTFEDYGIRGFVSTDQDPLSTFALDVDTASYSIAQQWLGSGSIPPPDSVRVEEFVNSFDYDYDAPSEGLNIQADGGPSPFDDDNVIVRIGVQAEEVANDERPDAALTFVVDTSGSMDRANRLGLVKTSLSRLTNELDRDDTVAIVTYSDDAVVILPPTPAAERDIILGAIEDLRTDGSTNLEAGLARGYDLAAESFRSGGINRVVLASDGVANVGLTDADGLAAQIRGDADRGIQLVTVGVGMGNFNDVVMEQLADQGDGFYAYVNDEREAERLFSDDLVSTLLTVAIDGKIQVEFDPDTVSAYRLIGFENRAVLDDDFRNDAVDAGELGAGHQVTALYELQLRSGIDGDDQLGTAQLRWEDPEERSVRETRLALTSSLVDDRWADTAEDFRLAVTVGAFAELLRQSPHVGSVSLANVAEEAESLSSGSGPIQDLADLIRQTERLG